MSLISNIITKLHPIWLQNHYIHLNNLSNKQILNFKNHLENEIFPDNFLNNTEYSGREIIYYMLTTIKTDLPKDIHEMIDELYISEKKPTFDIENKISKNIILWKGDITNLKIDSIVNAANSYLEGCFIPFHRCIDNVIHEKAGPHLREECRSWKCKYEKPGNCRISKGYHLPSKNILHTVGPIYEKNKDKSMILYDCYRACLNVGKSNGLKSIAFCCISTGEFGYPNKEAAEIACKSVKDWIVEFENYDYIVFNVFKEEDYEIYKEITKKYFDKNTLQIL